MVIPVGSFGLSFGIWEDDDIETQLNRQGLTLSIHADLTQERANALADLYVCGYLTASEVDKARNRLFKDIKSKVKPLTT